MQRTAVGGDLETEAGAQWSVMGHCLRTGQARMSIPPTAAGEGGKSQVHGEQGLGSSGAVSPVSQCLA